MSKKIVKELLTRWKYEVDTKQVKAAKKSVESLGKSFSAVKKSSIAFAKAERNRIGGIKDSWKRLNDQVKRYRTQNAAAMATARRQGGGGGGRSGGGGGGRGGVSLGNSAAFLAGRALGSTALTSALLGGAGLAGGFAVGAAVKVAGDRETMEKRFEGLLGNPEKAKEHLDTLTDFAKRTPFAITQLRKLSTQALGGGFDEGAIVPLFEQLGDVTQGNSVEFGRMLTNMIEIKNVGKAFTRDIRQFGRAGIPVFDALKQVFGKNGKAISGEALDKLITKGAVGFKDIVKAIELLRSGRFKDAMKKQMGTFNQSLSNFGDTIVEIGEKIGGPFLAPLTKSIQVITKALDGATESFGALFTAGFETIETFKKEFPSLAAVMDKSFKIMGVAAGLVLAAMMPITTLVSGLLLLLEDYGAFLDGRKSVIGLAMGRRYGKDNREIKSADFSPVSRAELMMGFGEGEQGEGVIPPQDIGRSVSNVSAEQNLTINTTPQDLGTVVNEAMGNMQGLVKAAAIGSPQVKN